MFRILGLDHVVLRVADMARARAFYCDVLGCTVARERGDLGLTQLRAGAALIDLVDLSSTLGRKLGAGPAARPEAGGRNMDHLCLRIEPFDAAAIAAHLRAHGVTPGEVAPRFGADGTGPSMYIADPDGNTV
ncbi:MAG: VOC family protein, partial [Rhodospirillaceae bacterium]|nr:VOC family protein [Rhodospirillaceae bacterium]